MTLKEKYLGQLVRLKHELETRSPVTFAKGLVMRVESVHRGKLHLKTLDKNARRIRGVYLSDVELLHEVKT